MPLYDIRCKDVARIVAARPKTMIEIGKQIHQLYPDVDAAGTWVRDPLTLWNPYIKPIDDRYKLSELGRAFVSLPGREGEDPTELETVFLLGTLLLDERQRRIVSELIALKKSTDKDTWIVNQTQRVLKSLGV